MRTEPEFPPAAQDDQAVVPVLLGGDQLSQVVDGIGRERGRERLGRLRIDPGGELRRAVCFSTR